MLDLIVESVLNRDGGEGREAVEVDEKAWVGVDVVGEGREERTDVTDAPGLTSQVGTDHQMEERR